MSADKCLEYPGEGGYKEYINEENPRTVWDNPGAVWRWRKCPNIEESYSDFDKESYECKVCGYYYNLYYDEMC